MESDKIKVARVRHGKCQICQQPVITDQAYTYSFRTITQNQCIIHYNCLKPANAPTWEDSKSKV